MPNFGKVFRFIKFDINSLKLKEVLRLRIRIKGITKIHNSIKITGEAKKSVTTLNFFVYLFRKSGHFLFSSSKRAIPFPETNVVIFSYNTKPWSS